MNAQTLPGPSISPCTSRLQESFPCLSAGQTTLGNSSSGKVFLPLPLVHLPSSPGHLCWANLPSWNQEKAHMALPGSIVCAGGFWPLVPGCCQLKGSQRIFRLGPSFSTHQVMLLWKRPGKPPEPFHEAGFWVGLTSKDLSRFAVKADLWFNPV